MADSFVIIAAAPWDFNFNQLALASTTTVLIWIYTATVTLNDRFAIRSGASLVPVKTLRYQ